MAISHHVVSRIVNAELRRVNHDSSITSVEGAVHIAWKRVNGRRLDGECSEDLGAAEHYLFARWLIAKYSPAYLPLLEAQTFAYDVSKALGINLQEGSCPQTPLSVADSQWKARGGSDGVFDFIGQTEIHHLAAPRIPFPPGLPVSAR